jgi:hypothetical protein
MYVREKVGIQLCWSCGAGGGSRNTHAGEFIKPCKAEVAAIKEQQGADTPFLI